MTKRQKHGGRKIGTPNKRTLEALEIFEHSNFCPLTKVIDRLTTQNISDDLFISTCLKLLEFKFPKRKAVEHSLDLINMSDEELVEETRLILSKIKP